MRARVWLEALCRRGVAYESLTRLKAAQSARTPRRSRELLRGSYALAFGLAEVSGALAERRREG